VYSLPWNSENIFILGKNTHIIIAFIIDIINIINIIL
jgi:hypothetical protein